MRYCKESRFHGREIETYENALTFTSENECLHRTISESNDLKSIQSDRPGEFNCWQPHFLIFPFGLSRQMFSHSPLQSFVVIDSLSKGSARACPGEKQLQATFLSRTDDYFPGIDPFL
ncbi:hypothetical protein CDAR_393671 [Caerostris darwini]|uniref:Uncharacterized protein n=1 Tax=Caerostris darwini TaxID=1538125 RepID=A0AAV4W794_9ARAC|nr:hypothetical protein CDAR_393671 [Caerostris darwini]